MAVNKVDYGDTNLIDLTQDTVDENSVLAGYTFHGADGNIKEGKVVVAKVIDDVNSQSTEDALSANQGRLLNIGINKTRDIISDAWNSSTTYTVDQYCIYNDCLWKCKVQHNGQTPSEGTYWTKTQIDDEILAIKNDVSTLNSNLKSKVKTYSSIPTASDLKSAIAVFCALRNSADTFSSFQGLIPNMKTKYIDISTGSVVLKDITWSKTNGTITGDISSFEVRFVCIF